MIAFYKPFPTYRVETNRSVLIHRPMVTVRATGPTGTRVVEGRLDTGSDETLLPWNLIDKLGVRLLPGKSADLHGLAGAERVMFGYVDFELDDPRTPIRWSHLAAFSTSGRLLFGLNGFLEYFNPRFDPIKREIKLQYRGKGPATRFLSPPKHSS